MAPQIDSVIYMMYNIRRLARGPSGAVVLQPHLNRAVGGLDPGMGVLSIYFIRL